MVKESSSRKDKSASGSPSASPVPKAVPQTAPLADWRQQMLVRLRAVITQADHEIVEERKWMKPSNPGGVPVWSRNGIVCTGEIYKSAVKLTFAKGASLEDPAGLFNSSLEGNVRRAIDFHQGDKVNERALKALIRAAVALNACRA